MNKYTPEHIKALLIARDDAVERGLLRIYERQTADEQNAGETRHSNGMGFAGCDARYGSYMARWVQRGNHLTGKHLEAARKMTMKYAGQLAIIANEKLEAKLNPFAATA